MGSVACFRLSRVQQREIWPHRVPRGNQRVRSRDSADGETAAGSRRLAGRSRHRRLHILGDPDPDVDDDDREDLETLATEITERVEIRLEHEDHYDWVAFVPQRESDAGADEVFSGRSPATTTSKYEESRPGSARPRSSSRTSSGTVSTDSMPRGHRTQCSDSWNEQSRNCRRAT